MKLTTKQNDDLAVRRGKDKEGQFVERGVGHKGVMREHPLLMQGPLVRATLEGRKTQTRRPLRNQPPTGYDLVRVCGPWAEFENDSPPLAKYSTKGPLGETGDRLWVRETFQSWRKVGHESDEWEPIGASYASAGDTIEYRATSKSTGPWTPSIHMPRRVCRLVLPLVSVRVERVQDITEEDARAEGVPHNSDRPIDKSWCATCLGHGIVERFALGTASIDDCSECNTAKTLFRNCWISIYGQQSWDANPWVWVAEWKEIEVSR